MRTNSFPIRCISKLSECDYQLLEKCHHISFARLAPYDLGWGLTNCLSNTSSWCLRPHWFHRSYGKLVKLQTKYTGSSQFFRCKHAFDSWQYIYKFDAVVPAKIIQYTILVYIEAYIAVISYIYIYYVRNWVQCLVISGLTNCGQNAETNLRHKHYRKGI